MQRRTIHNRRYNYLVHHLRPDGYFDENDVRLREPVLFEEHIGQFMTPEERAAPYPDDMTLMDRIFHGIDRRYVQDQWDREKQRQRQQLPEEESDEDDAEDDQDDDAGKDGGENDVVMTDVQSSSSKNLSINKRAAQQDENDGDDSDQEEGETDLSGVDLVQRERWNELTQLLEERWLDGLDINFDYAQVDDNPDYDDLRQLNQDMQDDYFDTEEAVGPSHDTGMQDF
ncbi:coiled-coil domain-containing protein-domain-containing protein [Gongronella butleri]|nr:coiled-coil domain-containing protein-domain-containing protein [Gongronella butleri]